ncbi:MAG: LysR family transcriptional regulator [Betaproteobacteria bacterium]|jgi:DNA-binding transcriptional LysR family regulator|nr:LysR family transcriptional regulator [Betaproteobacteria bacterium]
MDTHGTDLRRATSQLSVRQLRLIEAVAREGSVHRAARALGVSQPAASMLLRAAEQAVGQPLFSRDRRGAVPTGFGRLFIERLSIALAEIDAIDDSAADEGRPLLRLGTIPRAMQALLPRVLARLLAEEPALRVSVQEAPAAQLLAAVAAGTLDAAIGREVLQPGGPGSPGLGDLVFERLFDERTVIVERAKPGRATASATARVPLASLHARDWALPARGSFARELIDSAFTAAGLLPPLPRVESAVYASNIELAAEGMLLTLAPATAAEAMRRAGRIRIVEVEPPLPASPVFLIHRGRSRPLAALAALRSALLEEAPSPATTPATRAVATRAARPPKRGVPAPP